MSATPATDDSQLADLISREIANCVMELIHLERVERAYTVMLEKKGELESRIAYLQQMETR
jgi:hypothetical protein